MPKLAVGTRNPGKIDAVRRSLASYEKLRNFEIQGAQVESGVSDQPITMEETTMGAKTRAERARAAVEGADLGIGMESGLFTSGGKMFDVCACSIFDGEQHHVGYSCAWELPPRVVECVEKGMNLTDAFNHCKICDDPEIGDKGGALAVMTGNRVTRPDYTVQSIQMAILAMNPDHYNCSSSIPPGINDAIS
eukprot:TRINITY_DN28879_c0_g1_i1.p1 TRINITY_DN28879_c0_g1~~TRINITY_DN28879_c0_g1_i1.p1  ORF type:complete len:202 (+),score=34.06 TRINITY_DN28879_c0_g1_i1:33-608(+)